MEKLVPWSRLVSLGLAWSRLVSLGLAWSRLVAVIEPHYPKAVNGRRPYPIETMLHIHCMQHWYNMSDPAMEDTLTEIASMRMFAGLSSTGSIPDHTTIMNFRHLLKRHGLARQIFKEVSTWLRDAGAGFYDHADNDYFEFASDYGVVVTGCLMLAVLWAFISAIRAQIARKTALMRGIAFSATMAIIALAMHSTVDLNLQIPANAATFVVILALGQISLYQKSRRR